MAKVKMRINKKENAKCCSCGNDRKHSLEMFDIALGGQILTICDECNKLVLDKTLRAEVGLNQRVKSKQDMEVLYMRGRRYMAKQEHLSINEAEKGMKFHE